MEMSPVPGVWEAAGLVCKFLFYCGAAAALGGSLSLLLYGDSRRSTVSRILIYQTTGGLLGFHAILINFLVQVGQINDAGLAGAFDWGMTRVLLDTPLGDSSLYRLLGFTLITGVGLLLLRQCHSLTAPPQISFYQRNLFLNLMAFLLLLLSFRFGGHVSVLDVSVQVALAVHFSAFALWIGSLYPLYELTSGDNLVDLRATLQRFGGHAIGIVAALVAAGVILVINLIHSPMELIETAYGRTLALKLLLVLVLLGIAALNKFILVPQLVSGNSVARFRKSVRVEAVVATLLLLLTAYFSTAVGPMSHA